ncbi:superoxide dismutase family protein [Riemerella columbina]|uniref:superoxide dismutase family protein n=1 Tax=Riemerella columbina TaxID=103810 RepID=UPI00266F37A0|nr:superoxide dismutase family protein [Riemerella columbina]WKS95169.1 superoxide dismutase family protein [Riemerella columbina]
MKTLKVALGAVVIALSVASCSTVKKTYTIAPKSGTPTEGTATLSQRGNQVTLDVKVANLTPGEHAIHIHEKGDCSSADGKSAGGHWNPTGHDHGKWDTQQFHKGDIGNLVAGEDGKAHLVFSTDQWCLGCDDATKNLFGKAIIIHAGVDDFTSQPTGNAGGRVGCVEIKK